jgi:hypothetical protein
MRLFKFILFVWLMPLTVLAQKVNVSGKITSADTKAAIPGASVYLSNSSVGTSTNNQGAFALNSLSAGQYMLVVSAVGYESSVQTVLVNNEPINLDISLSPKVIALQEVRIRPMSKSDRKAALARFKAEFIGTGPYAADCEIKNPDVLSFSFSDNKTILQASTNDFLIVDNDALGYRIKFTLNSYESNFYTGDIAYKGNRVFEEMKGGDAKKRRWQQRRDNVYYGSAMHFYRSLAKDSLEANGFKIYRLSREFNTARPSDEQIEKALQRTPRSKRDSLMYWARLQQSSHYTNNKFKGKFLVADIVQRSEKPGLFGLRFPDNLYVQYTKRWETNFYRDVYRSPQDLNYATTIVSMMVGKNFIVFDKNGAVLGDGPFYEGDWSQQRISTQLPVDYVPYSKIPRSLP